MPSKDDRKVLAVDPRKLVVSFFILWQIFVTAVQSLPSNSVLHDQWMNGIQFYVTGTGAWLGSLAFFSPSPPNQVVRMDAEVRFSDGTKTVWREPQWSKMGLWQKFVACREIKYFDNIYRDAESGAWPYFADHIAYQYSVPGKRVAHVALIRHWVNIPMPPAGPAMATWWPKENAEQQSYNFFNKDY